MRCINREREKKKKAFRSKTMKMDEREGASEVATASPPPRPTTLTLPPRPSLETLFTVGTGFSPGPMTLVSNFFSDPFQDSCSPSFSQLLAGAMTSPLSAFSGSNFNFFPDISNESFLKEDNFEGGSEKKVGFKQNRPMSLVVAPSRSPVFLFTPGLSPSGLLNSPGLFSPLQSPFGMSHQQALAHVTAQAALSQSYIQTQAEYQPPSVAPSAESLAQLPSFAPNETIQQDKDSIVSGTESSKLELSEVSQSDRKPLPASLAVDKPANDGYNWRKYGQKHVKASEYPRSYYKCTHPNCHVKKKVERSDDGQISEIIYKGQHNHELPRPNKRTKIDGDVDGSTKSQTKFELGAHCWAELGRSKEVLPSRSVPKKNQVSTLPMPQQLCGSSDHDEMSDAEMVINEGDDHESNSKRRNTNIGASDEASSHKTVTEPRIIVQTRSEVDLLDDGYKWRKYGQKVVKGKLHPRSYYKCTFVGCNVRKHVERASTDPKAVITTYEGKHNHDIPAGRKSGYNASNGSALQLKPQKMVAGMPTLHVELDF